MKGSIPAGAGEPLVVWPNGLGDAVYPRGCGGTQGDEPGVKAVQGLSPRVRGNRRSSGRTDRLQGSIPAGAGEPSPAGRLRASTRVYPRGCGEPPITSVEVPQDRVYPRGCGGTHTGVRLARRVPGLSPRVRGNRRRRDEPDDTVWSIPAGAGEPSPSLTLTATRRVYPRGCGGTCGRRGHGRNRKGLSPRVRGNRDIDVKNSFRTGSIPAGAGEPAGGSG